VVQAIRVGIMAGFMAIGTHLIWFLDARRMPRVSWWTKINWELTKMRFAA
jgi:hypothetical protein